MVALHFLVALHHVFDVLGLQDFLKSHHRGAEHGGALRFGLKFFLGHFGIAVFAGGRSDDERDDGSQYGENDDGDHCNLTPFEHSASQETMPMTPGWHASQQSARL